MIRHAKRNCHNSCIYIKAQSQQCNCSKCVWPWYWSKIMEVCMVKYATQQPQRYLLALLKSFHFMLPSFYKLYLFLKWHMQYFNLHIGKLMFVLFIHLFEFTMFQQHLYIVCNILWCFVWTYTLIIWKQIMKS